METGLTFRAGDILLSGLFQRASNTHGVIVTHPHPLYGGDMYNSVVASVVDVYAENGYSTLRFNFRGVGESGGGFGNGVGEVDDVFGAIEFLLASGLQDIHLVGYSFGAWVNAHCADLPEEVKAVVAVSPPVSFLDYSRVTTMSRLKLIISGTMDEFARPDETEAHRLLVNPQAQLEMIDGCDHFYSGYTSDLELHLQTILDQSS